MWIRNYYIDTEGETVEYDKTKFKATDITSIFEHCEYEYHKICTDGYAYDCEVDIFKIIGTDIMFSVEDFAGITEDEETVSIHMVYRGECEQVGRALRINKTTYKFELSDLYFAEYGYKDTKWWRMLRRKHKREKKQRLGITKNTIIKTVRRH